MKKHFTELAKKGYAIFPLGDVLDDAERKKLIRFADNKISSWMGQIYIENISLPKKIAARFTARLRLLAPEEKFAFTQFILRATADAVPAGSQRHTDNQNYFTAFLPLNCDGPFLYIKAKSGRTRKIKVPYGKAAVITGNLRSKKVPGTTATIHAAPAKIFTDRKIAILVFH